MGTNSNTKQSSWHGHLDAEIASITGQLIQTISPNYSIIQEREVSYRFSLHQHPYVQPLIRRLLRKGAAGLLAADTEYAPGELSLPAGVDIELTSACDTSLAASSSIRLIEDISTNGGGGAWITLSAGHVLVLGAAAPARLLAGTCVTLSDPLTPTPHPRSSLTLRALKSATISSETRIRLAADTPLSLAGGATVMLPAGTEVLLAAGSPVTVASGTDITVLRRSMRPVDDLYAAFFQARYHPNTTLVQQPYPVKDLDFSSGGAYAVYNWELFYHVPLTIAINLSKNQRFAEAQRWFHTLFDPTDDSDGPTPERFWKVRPFQTTDVAKIEEILVNLATSSDQTLRDETIQSIEAWKDAPFRPHVIARYRQQAYMYKTVMAYLDNLIAWGDALFRQDTGEAIDEALQLYVLAANILGPRPQPVPKKGAVRPQTYANLRQDLRQFGTVMRDMEAALPFDLMPFPADGGGDTDRLATLRSLGKALYFCVPRNDKLLGYWDTVADRLFKIRNSLNIQGIFRRLALFEPPIDPALLARAAAAGLDVGSIVNGLNQPLPLVRFQLLVQKAAEIAQEVKALGSNLLATMEKEDNEAIALLRARHERVVLEMVEHVRYAQWQEAIKAKEGLFQSLALAVQRYTFYELQLGKKADEIAQAIPELDELDKDRLSAMKFSMQEPSVALRDIAVDIAQDLGASGGKIISSHEAQEMAQLKDARDKQNVAAALDKLAGMMANIPNFGVHVQPFGPGSSITFGGSNLGTAMSLTSSFYKMGAEKNTYEAGKAARIGSYARRELDWTYQSNLAAGEIAQIFKQLRAAQIREAIAEQELKNHRQQMKHAAEIERFLNGEGAEKTGKKTNRALYAWMKREVRGLYGQVFQLAFDIAKKAERALQHELGDPSLSYLQFGYQSGKEGLLAGEKLYLDIKRMELAYHELNRREYELTKHVSLLQVSPTALLQLRTTGRCTVSLPEALFDMDGPGHYFRRIKTVAVSIPCVTGPYTSVNCTLTLTKSSIRASTNIGDGYERTGPEDSRFSDHFGSLQSIVTSSGQNDSGLFETNLRDERYLPFEGSGVISEWQLELPANVRQFDYSTITDVILHIRYTAREGGVPLRGGAVSNLNALIGEAQAAGSVRLFSIRHEFPSEWAKFKSVKLTATQTVDLTVLLRAEHYPFWSKGQAKTVARADLFATSTSSTSLTVKVNGTDVPLQSEQGNALLQGKILASIAPTGSITLNLNNDAVDDMWLAIAWKS